jgi:hypothetical protein
MKNRIFIRESDRKVFKLMERGHWSTIQAEDGETDTVKWYGGSDVLMYVSASKGFSYELHDAEVEWE